MTHGHPDTTGASTSDTAARPPHSRWRRLLIGPNGLRAGWRVLVFLAIVFIISAAVRMVAAFVVRHVPALLEWVQTQRQGMTPFFGVFELLQFLVVLAAAAIMSRIERRSFAEYGLPGSAAFRTRFWEGIPLGFGMLCLLLGLIAAFGAFGVTDVALTPGSAAADGVLYFLGFVCVGLFEEFTFRGYLQSTLASGIGFWPAAIVLSLAFGAIHLGNPGEAHIGALMAACFGLVSAFALRRTGNLWFSIGMHASWDWGETYFFGTPDSGLVAQGHLLDTSFHGARWLTGGTVGPEGSVLVFLVLAAWALVIHLWFPARPGRAIGAAAQ